MAKTPLSSVRNKKIIRSVTVSQSCVFFRELAVHLRSMGYEVLPLSSPGPELNEMRDADNFRIIALPIQRHISPWRDAVSLFRLVMVLLRERPLMVHSMTPKAGLLSMLAAWITRVPVRIHTFTGLVWPTATGFQRSILMLTDRLTCACATHIIPEGEGVKHDLLTGRITQKPMRILGYGHVRGVDLQRFDPQRLVRTPHNSFRYLFVGRIVGDKGIGELVEAFVRLHTVHPSTELVLVGSEEPSLDPLSPTTLQMLTACPAIKMVGETRGDQLVQAYTDADCFVMPSYREGFPNTVIEAGAMSLPSIVTDINGSREIITDGENGLIIPPHDAPSLHDAMLRLLTDDALHQKMSRAARPLVASRFDKSYVQQCLISFYEEILNS